MRVVCLYCDVENDALETAGYCDNCGKKLPNSAMIRTRRAISSGSSGEELAPVQSTRSPVADAFLITAVVQLFCGGVFLIVGPALISPVPESFLVTTILWTMVPAIVFMALSLLARVQPKLAVLTASGLYVVWMVSNFLVEPAIAGAWLLVHLVMLSMLAWLGWLALRSRTEK